MPDAPVVSIVDDDHTVRSATRAFVRSLGYRAATFPSAEDFLASSEIDATDCVIADIQMPGMSGLDLQRALAHRGRKLPIIFITAFPDDRIRQQAIDAGAIGMLTKPCDGDMIVKCLEAALARDI